jgi:hypothetical protein
MFNLLIKNAQAYTYFDVGSWATSSLSVAGNLISDLGPIATMIIGLLLGALVLGIIIGFLRK